MSDNLAKVLQFPEERSKEKNDFISFIEHCADEIDGALLTEKFKDCVLKKNVDLLKQWFFENGYEISKEQCITIINNADNLSILKNNITMASY